MIRILGSIFSAIIICAIVGVVAVASGMWWYSRDLPNYTQLKEYQAPTMSRVYASTGEPIAEFAQERRLYTPLDEIPPLVRHAFISAEDKNFYTHDGVDLVGIAKAAVRNVRNLGEDKRLQGASTITQQITKNFLLSGERSFDRKIKEALLAMKIDKSMSKDQILELYLNQIFLGARAYGVTAAALNYFGVSPDELTPAQVAYLAALPKAPNNYHPVRNYDRAFARRNYVLEEMFENEYITQEEYETAIEQPLETLISELGREADNVPPMGYFTEEIRRTLVERYGEEEVYGGGLAIRSTINPELQSYAEQALQDRLQQYDRSFGYRGPVSTIPLENMDNWRRELSRTNAPRDIKTWEVAVVLNVTEDTVNIGFDTLDPEPQLGKIAFSDFQKWAKVFKGDKITGNAKKPADVLSRGDVILVQPVMSEDKKTVESWSLRQISKLQGAVIAMDPYTGRVLAMQGGFSYQSSVFNRATQAMRQPGSSFKPFVYAAALEQGYTPATVVLDAPVVIDQGGNRGLWKPKNYTDRFYGPSPLRLGIELSRNLMTVRVAQDVGMDTIAEYAEDFGVYENMPPHYSYALGAGETTLYKMVAAYAMFDNGGMRIEPTLIDRIQDRYGKTIYKRDARACIGCAAESWDNQNVPLIAEEGERVMDAVTAYQVVSMMEGVVLRGTATKLKGLGFPVAGKTGTTNESRDGWFIGFTPDLVFGCYVGFDNPKSMGRKATGGGLCGPVFQDFMRKAKAGKPKIDFTKPSGVVMANVNRLTGQRVPNDLKGDQYIMEAFREGNVPEIYKSGPIIGEQLSVVPLKAEEINPVGVRRPPVNNGSIGLGTGGLY